MSDTRDIEIRQIVQRVLNQALGLSTQGIDPAKASAQTESTSITESQRPDRKVVAIGADHGGFELKETLKADLPGMGFDVIDVGTHSKEAVDYPDFAHEVAALVGDGKAWRGIVIDGAGIGSCIVANKVPGVRAGLAYDYSSAVNSREHNDTNVLTLGAGLIGVNLARQIVQTWLSTMFGGGRHARRVEKIVAVEKQYLK
jgi:ribose 5-phosphate isomerase B